MCLRLGTGYPFVVVYRKRCSIYLTIAGIGDVCPLIITTISPLKVSTTIEYSNYGFILVIPNKTQHMKTSFEEYNQIQIVGKAKNMP